MPYPSTEDYLHEVDAGRLEPIHRSLTVEEKLFDDAERTITAYCTTLDRDRYGDTIQPSGMRNEHYRNNPVILWAHNYELPPIAKSLWEKPDARGVRMCIQFDSREDAMDIYRLYREGYLNAFSIGFLPISFERVFDGNTLTGLNFTEWELLECSAVPVPANPNALQDALSRGLVQSDRMLKALQAGPLGASGRDTVPQTVSDDATLLGLHEHFTKMRALVDECLSAAQQFRQLALELGSIPSDGSPGGMEGAKPYDPNSLIEEIACNELRRRTGRAL